MRNLILTILTAAAMSAAPLTTCPPEIPIQAGVPMAASCGLDPFVATPGSTWWWGWNDNPIEWPFNDFDFEDIHGTAVISADGTSAEFAYLGAISVFWNSMFYGDTFMFSNIGTPVGATVTIETVPNSDIILSMTTIVLWHNFEWSSFDSSHFRSGCLEGCGSRPSEVPEPGALVMAALGVGLIGVKFRNRN